MTDSPRTSHIRFGLFELDVAAGELRREGLKVKLQNQLVRVLTLLLKPAGEVVPRDDFREEIWPADTFVDFDRGPAINKIREALGDSADNPRFVETVPRRGYRFIAPVEGAGGEAAKAEPGPEGPRREAATEIAATGGEQSSAPTEPRHDPRRWLAVGAIAAVFFALGLLSRDFFIDPGPAPDHDRQVRKFQLQVDGVSDPAISPDGTMIAYCREDGLWIHRLDRFDPRKVPDSARARQPFWSPDSKFVGYEMASSLQKVPADGGPGTKVCELPGPGGQDHYFWGASWCTDDKFIFAPGRGLYEVSAQGGIPHLSLESPSNDRWPINPECLPDSRTILFTYHFGTAPQGEIGIRSNDSTDTLFDLGGVRSAVYSPTGHIFYTIRSGPAADGIWAIPFSFSSLSLAGEPFLVAGGGEKPSVSRNGVLVYLSAASPDMELVLVDRKGGVQRVIGEPRKGLRRPAISPNGRYVAVNGRQGEQQQVWIYDLSRGVSTPLTFGDDSAGSPAWDPSGTQVAFNRGGDIWVKKTFGATKEELLVGGPLAEAIPEWSPDGKYLLYSITASDFDLYYRSFENGGEAVAFANAEHSEVAAKISPDGKHVAYMSNESGQYEVHVGTFPVGEWKGQVSVRGGSQPKWSPGGDELFYVEDNRLMAVSVKAGPDLEFGAPRELFDGDNIGVTFDSSFRGVAPIYDVAPDGERFVVARPVEGSVETYLNVVENWFAEFDK